jgi:hypothetical protein
VTRLRCGRFVIALAVVVRGACGAVSSRAKRMLPQRSSVNSTVCGETKGCRNRSRSDVKITEDMAQLDELTARAAPIVRSSGLGDEAPWLAAPSGRGEKNGEVSCVVGPPALHGEAGRLELVR